MAWLRRWWQRRQARVEVQRQQVLEVYFAERVALLLEGDWQRRMAEWKRDSERRQDQLRAIEEPIRLETLAVLRQVAGVLEKQEARLEEQLNAQVEAREPRPLTR